MHVAFLMALSIYTFTLYRYIFFAANPFLSKQGSLDSSEEVSRPFWKGIVLNKIICSRVWNRNSCMFKTTIYIYTYNGIGRVPSNFDESDNFVLDDLQSIILFYLPLWFFNQFLNYFSIWLLTTIILFFALERWAL